MTVPKEAHLDVIWAVEFSAASGTVLTIRAATDHYDTLTVQYDPILIQPSWSAAQLSNASSINFQLRADVRLSRKVTFGHDQETDSGPTLHNLMHLYDFQGEDVTVTAFTRGLQDGDTYTSTAAWKGTLVGFDNITEKSVTVRAQIEPTYTHTLPIKKGRKGLENNTPVLTEAKDKPLPINLGDSSQTMSRILAGFYDNVSDDFINAARLMGMDPAFQPALLRRTSNISEDLGPLPGDPDDYGGYWIDVNEVGPESTSDFRHELRAYGEDGLLWANVDGNIVKIASAYAVGTSPLQTREDDDGFGQVMRTNAGPTATIVIPMEKIVRDTTVTHYGNITMDGRPETYMVMYSGAGEELGWRPRHINPLGPLTGVKLYVLTCEPEGYASQAPRIVPQIVTDDTFATVIKQWTTSNLITAGTQLKTFVVPTSVWLDDLSIGPDVGSRSWQPNPWKNDWRFAGPNADQDEVVDCYIKIRSVTEGALRLVAVGLAYTFTLDATGGPSSATRTWRSSYTPGGRRK